MDSRNSVQYYVHAIDIKVRRTAYLKIWLARVSARNMEYDAHTVAVLITYMSCSEVNQINPKMTGCFIHSLLEYNGYPPWFTNQEYHGNYLV